MAKVTIVIEDWRVWVLGLSFCLTPTPNQSRFLRPKPVCIGRLNFICWRIENVV